jgi:adenylosuccinate synthase
MSKAVLLVGLGFGDEGKGSIVDHFVRLEDAKLVVRYNGGAQASHAVVTDDGRDHRFSQFGSGTFAGARTYLSRHMLFNPTSLVPEARHLIELGVPDPYKLLSVDVGALLTTPFHVAANRIREIARNNGAHGSCGMGIGETVAYSWDCAAGKWGSTSAFPYQDTPFAFDLKDPAMLQAKLALLCKRLKESVAPLFEHGRPAMAPEWDILNDFEGTMAVFQPYLDRIAKHVAIVRSEWLDEELAKDQTIVFEGAQGVLLDENHGFHPHTTWSTTTFENAQSLVRRVKGVETKRVGVLRGYSTRHGYGPFVTEDRDVPVPKGEHNSLGRWQADFRMGHFDAVMARYALDVCGGIDELALTCLDHLRGAVKAAWSYEVRSDAGRAWQDRLPVYELADPSPGTTLDAHLAKQETLTNQLKASTAPVYREFYNLETFVSEVEKTTETPIKILSFGPKASDKKAR